MDRTAIEAITELAALSTAQRITTDIPAAIVPDKVSVKSLEHLMNRPARFKGHFVTSILQEFADYYRKNSQATSIVYIDPETMQARAIFDHGDANVPQWGDHTAELKLQAKPAWRELLKHNNVLHSQTELIDFCMDWRDHIRFEDDKDEAIDFVSAIARIRKLTINATQKTESEQANFSSNRSAMENIEVLSGSAQPPARIVFKTTPYEGFDDVIALCSIRAVTGSDQKTVQIKYRIEGLDVLTDRISLEFREKLFTRLDDALVYVGTMEHRGN